jgi:hypothetical protein
VPLTGELWQKVISALHDLARRYGKWGSESSDAARRYQDQDAWTPLAGLVAFLADFGVVAGDPGEPAITMLTGPGMTTMSRSPST